MKIISGLLMAMIMTSCGSNTSSDLTSKEAKKDSVIVNEAILTHVTAEAINAGINPEMSAYRISGQVLLGNNVCESNDKNATLVQRIKGNSIEVAAVVHASSSAIVACPRNYDPVYANLSLTVRSQRSQDIIVKNVNTMGNNLALEDLMDQATNNLPATEKNSVISDLKVKPVNGGINPEHAAVNIKGKVYLASNSCFSQGLKAKLVQHFVDGENRIEVVAVIVTTEAYDPGRICTMQYSPVAAVVETTVFYETEKVEVLNVNSFDNTVNINDLI